MAKAGLRNVAAGANAITLKKGIDKASISWSARLGHGQADC